MAMAAALATTSIGFGCPGVHSITAEEFDELQTMGATIGALRNVFVEEGGSASALRMASAVIRQGADALDRIAVRWEKEDA